MTSKDLIRFAMSLLILIFIDSVLSAMFGTTRSEWSDNLILASLCTIVLAVREEKP